LDIKDFIQVCINDRVIKSSGTIKQINVFVDAKRKFVQINGVFYTPDVVNDTQDIFINSDIKVTGWDSINKENLKKYSGVIDGLEVLYSCRQEK
jgi:hypothetical protein